jgi:hypothetical protein
MKRYKFLIINYTGSVGGKGVNLYCTDPYTLDWIHGEVKELVPGFKSHFGRKDMEGNFNFYQIHQLKGKDYEIAHWIFRRACEEGWRPIAASTPDAKSFHKYDDVTFKLLKEEQQDD